VPAVVASDDEVAVVEPLPRRQLAPAAAAMAR
jgi:hypothetical protein